MRIGSLASDRMWATPTVTSDEVVDLMKWLCQVGPSMTQVDTPARPTAQPPDATPSAASTPGPGTSRRAAWLALGAGVALVVAVLLSVSLGTLRLDPAEAIRAVFDPADSQVSTVVRSEERRVGKECGSGGTGRAARGPRGGGSMVHAE